MGRTLVPDHRDGNGVTTNAPGPNAPDEALGGEASGDEGARLAALQHFLDGHGLSGAALAPLADDCSFRRYFRLVSDGASRVVMDAPPDLEEIAPFASLSDMLNSLGYSAPRILGRDDGAGFLLLDDFGDTTYTNALTAGADEVSLYAAATDVLVDLHARPQSDFTVSVPHYDDAKLLDEAAMFVDWYLGPGLGLTISAAARADYLAAWSGCLGMLREAPDTLVLRDYHVDNLMVLGDREGVRACGLLDFQDAVIGPASYDMVSLLQDSRRDISDALTRAMLERYFTALDGQVSTPISRDGFMRSYFGFGAQRALKVFGVFARQSVLYGNHRYLEHVPRLWRLTLANLARPECAPELSPVREWIEDHVPQSCRITPRPGGAAL